MTHGDWQSLLKHASQLRRAGRVAEAIHAYKRALALKPDLADSWYNLGWLQRQARAFDDALASYQRALDLNVAEPEEVRINRAVIFSDHLHRPDAAARELEAALETNPGYVPALLNLGNLREDLGDREAARSAYARALTADPDNRLALARLAGVSHATRLDQALAEQIRVALRSPGLSAAEQADLGFALAGLLDAAEQYEEAFEVARAANRASRAATGARYDRSAVEGFIDRLVASFQAPGAASDQVAPVFIVGMFRSGSTLVEQMLGAHEKVTVSGELDLIPHLAGSIPAYPESVSSAGAATIAEWREAYLRGLPEQPGPHRIITDKRPDNFLHVGLIKSVFPSAKIVHTRRSPLDNLLSVYFLHLSPAMSFALDLDDAAHWYGQQERLMAHWKSLYPDDIFELDYDALVRDPQPVLGSLLDFLSLDREEGLLDFHARRSTVKTASVWQVRQPLHTRSSGRWRNYRAQLKALAERFGETD